MAEDLRNESGIYAPAAVGADRDHRGVAATGWGDYLPIAVLVIGGIVLAAYLGRTEPALAPDAVAVELVAVTAIPDGAGLVAESVDGVPFVSVYFDTASTQVTPDVAPAAAELKAYVDSHPDSGLAVSGYNDPRGDAAMNAELSKNRAIAVRSALVDAGIAEAAIILDKPAATTDAGTTLTNARRVDIKVIDDAGAQNAYATQASPQ